MEEVEYVYLEYMDLVGVAVENEDVYYVDMDMENVGVENLRTEDLGVENVLNVVVDVDVGVEDVNGQGSNGERGIESEDEDVQQVEMKTWTW